MYKINLEHITEEQKEEIIKKLRIIDSKMDIMTIRGIITIQCPTCGHSWEE